MTRLYDITGYKIPSLATEKKFMHNSRGSRTSKRKVSEVFVTQSQTDSQTLTMQIIQLPDRQALLALSDMLLLKPG
jgi:hypothetical protein